MLRIQGSYYEQSLCPTLFSIPWLSLVIPALLRVFDLSWLCSCAGFSGDSDESAIGDPRFLPCRSQRCSETPDGVC